MKKLFLAGFVMLALTAVSGFAQEADYSMSVGLDLPTIGWVRTNDAGEITGVSGLNIGLGFSSKNYYEPVEFGAFNPFWHWGTVALLFPYVGIGGDFVFDNGFYVSIATFYLAPYIGFGFYF